MEKRTAVIIDYQNIHLTGHGLWCTQGEAVHTCLVHPLHFANRLVQARNLVEGLIAAREGREPDTYVVSGVKAYRGIPSNKRAPSQYRRSLAQQSEWTRDSRVDVLYRPLKYYSENGRTVVKEKGVDVMVALSVVVAAAGNDYDATILASHDTDVEPAVQLAHQLGAQIETGGWMNCKRLSIPGQTLWHTALDEQAFISVRDLKDYS